MTTAAVLALKLNIIQFHILIRQFRHVLLGELSSNVIVIVRYYFFFAGWLWVEVDVATLMQTPYSELAYYIKLHKWLQLTALFLICV